MPNVIDGLRREHVRMARLLDILAREIAAFENGQAPDYDLVGDILAYALNYPDLVHHPTEELVLERLLARAPEAADEVGDLTAEHARLAALTRRFAAALQNVLQDHTLPRDWFVDVARDYLGFSRRHMQMEEVLFFPAALRHLTDEDWADIAARRDRRDDPLRGGDGAEAERFRRLVESVEAMTSDDAAD